MMTDQRRSINCEHSQCESARQPCYQECCTLQGDCGCGGRLVDGYTNDAIVQVGANLSMARLAPQAEAVLDKPVIAINTATCWHALRPYSVSGFELPGAAGSPAHRDLPPASASRCDGYRS